MHARRETASRRVLGIPQKCIGLHSSRVQRQHENIRASGTVAERKQRLGSAVELLIRIKSRRRHGTRLATPCESRVSAVGNLTNRSFAANVTHRNEMSTQENT